MKIKIERLSPEHLVEIRNCGALEGKIGANDIFQYWESYKTGDAFIGRTDDQILAAAGVMTLWPGCGEGWAILTPAATGLSVVRKFREMFDLILVANNYHRIQAMVRSDFVAGLRFAKWMGFEPEGIMRQFDTDKNDYVRLAKL